MLDPELCERVLKLWMTIHEYDEEYYHYCANDTLRSGFPDGTDCEVFSMQALRLSAQQTADPFDREHVTIWMRRHMPNYGILTSYGVDLSKRKWSVDMIEDLERVRKIYKNLPEGEFGYQVTCAMEDQ